MRLLEQHDSDRASDEDVETLLDLIRKQIIAEQVNFDSTISNIKYRRTLLQSTGDDIDHDAGEYCYHLISVLLESQKLINGEKYSSDYIDEHCGILTRYAKMIGQETDRDYDYRKKTQT